MYLFDMMVKWRITDFQSLWAKNHSMNIYKRTGGIIFGRFISRDIVLILLQTLTVFFKFYLIYQYTV